MEADQDKVQYYVLIGHLIFKEIEGLPLTEREREDLRVWRNGGEERKLIDEGLRDRRALMQELTVLNDRYKAAASIEQVFRILGLEVERPGEVSAIGRAWMRGMSAAAAVIFLMLGSWWLVTNKEGSGPAPLRPAEAGVAVQKPDKAVLILSDGTQIPLDSARDGQVAQQGGVKVVKMNGQVSYRGGDRGEPVAYNTMATPRGGQYLVVLPDSTRVWLNAVSSLRYPTVFSGRERKVELNGEAYFDVAPNKSSVFVVAAGDVEVRVLGTQFDIMAYGDEAIRRTTLVEGKVMVARGAERQVVTVGQQAMVGRDSGFIMVDANPDIDKAVAWRSGSFKFSEADIRSLMRELSRWYDIDVVYEITDFSGRYGGRIDRSLPLPAVLKLLEGNGIHHYRTEGNKVIVLP
ncbi:MAG TPA: FecR domain-containing protein [Puia sp.]|nr:FecR domain-containing protein [Puia sp.]